MISRQAAVAGRSWRICLVALPASGQQSCKHRTVKLPLQVELIGRVQRQREDNRYYTCICYVKVVGTPVYGFLPSSTHNSISLGLQPHEAAGTALEPEQPTSALLTSMPVKAEADSSCDSQSSEQGDECQECGATAETSLGGQASQGNHLPNVVRMCLSCAFAGMLHGMVPYYMLSPSCKVQKLGNQCCCILKSPGQV